MSDLTKINQEAGLVVGASMSIPYAGGAVAETERIIISSSKWDVTSDEFISLCFRLGLALGYHPNSLADSMASEAIEHKPDVFQEGAAE